MARCQGHTSKLIFVISGQAGEKNFEAKDVKVKEGEGMQTR